MKINNVKYYGDDFRFHYGDVEMENGLFTSVIEHGAPIPETLTMIPGLVDIHVHGNCGVDFSDGEYDGVVKMARFLAKAGTTSFSPTSMTLPEEKLANAYRAAVKLRDTGLKDCASVRSITMEGPFFSEKKKGAQAAEHLRLPDIDVFRRLQSEADGMIRIACVAPELGGADEYIRAISTMGVTVAEAHTNADYDTASRGFEAGARHLTHLYNAMPPLLHREPGVIGAAAECDNVTAELICDGIHVHPSAVRAAFKLFGPERICLVSDALAACGISDGSCMLGGQRVTIWDGRATLADGTIAGSIATLFECLRKAVSFGISPEDAVRCATANPARVLGAEDIGVIAEGKRADFLLCDSNWTLKDVYIAGNKIGGTK